MSKIRLPDRRSRTFRRSRKLTGPARSGKKALVIDRRPHTGRKRLLRGARRHPRPQIRRPHLPHLQPRSVGVREPLRRIQQLHQLPGGQLQGQALQPAFQHEHFLRHVGRYHARPGSEMIDRQRHEAGISEPRNLEEQAISLVGIDIYERLVKGYTEKQWGRDCSELPSFIIKRLPVRFTYDNNYFNDLYQGIPIGGYNKLIDALFEGADIKTSVDFLTEKEKWMSMADKVVYTGAIDEYFEYCFGKLEYRTVRFETEVLDMGNYQGNAVVNYTDYEVPYTRIIEHKHFEFGTQPKTVITREYPAAWEKGKEPYYPINDPKNDELFDKYERRALEEKNVLFGGRLGMYRYMDMDKVIEEALNMAETELTYEEV